MQAIAADSLLMNATGSSASPTAVAVSSCSSASNALTYNTTTHAFGCNTISGSGTVNSGTTNQLAYYASSTTAVSGLATGNSGLLVTSAGGVPSIGTAIPSGVTATTQSTGDNSTKVATTAYVDGTHWRLIGTSNPSSVATVDFTSLPSDINQLQVFYDAVPVTNDTSLIVQLYDDTGTLDSTSGHYAFSNMATNNGFSLGTAPSSTSSSSSSYTSGIVLNYVNTNASINNGSAGGIQGNFQMYNILSTAHRKMLNYQGSHLSGDATLFITETGSGWRNVAGKITGLRLFFVSGNISAGNIEVWGSP
jgi:hypothetical protein